MIDFETKTTTEQRKTQSRTLFEPDFQPISYGKVVDTTIYAEPEFEIEKPISFGKEFSDQDQAERSYIKSHGDKEIVAHGDTEIVAHGDREIVAHGDREIVAKQNGKIKLNARGKIAVTVYSIIVAIFMAFAIYSGVMIASYSSQIAAKSEIVARQEQVINSLSSTYNSLGESDSIYVSASEFEAISEANTTHISDFEMAERSKTQVSTNWFEDLCEKIRKLFS